MDEYQEEVQDDLEAACRALRSTPIEPVPPELRQRVLGAVCPASSRRQGPCGIGPRRLLAAWSRWWVAGAAAAAGVLAAFLYQPGPNGTGPLAPGASPVPDWQLWALNDAEVQRGWQLVETIQSQPVTPTYAVTRTVVENLATNYQDAQRVRKASAHVQEAIEYLTLAPTRPMNLRWMQEGLLWARLAAKTGLH
jgi:hypothetical protein